MSRNTRWLSGSGIVLLTALAIALVWGRARHANFPWKGAALSRAPLSFADMTKEAGIAFSHFNATRHSLLPEDNGSGAAWGDYDNDGDDDLYLTNFAGRLLMEQRELARRPGNSLYRNNSNGTFTDVSRTAGVARVGWDNACLWFDYDGDGWLDLAVTHFEGVVLYRNNGNGTFAEVTGPAGLGGIRRYLLGMTAGDYDRDGDLDLYLCGYVRFDREKARRRPLVAGRPAVWTNPVPYPAEANVLLRNNGDGTFTDATAGAGVANPEGKSMQAVFCDLDNDGWCDLYVGNDVSTADVLYRNNRNGTFSDVSVPAGTHDFRASMGITAGDLWHRGWMDLFVTHWVAEDHALWKNMSVSGKAGGGLPERGTHAPGHPRRAPGYPQSGQAPGHPRSGSGAAAEVGSRSQREGRMLFDDQFPRLGLGPKPSAYVGWGAGLYDFDNDGYLDLLVVNGSTIEDELTQEVLTNPKLIPQPAQLFRYHPVKGQFVELGAHGGSFFGERHVSRGATFSDYDNDGRVDCAIVQHGERAQLLRNVSPGALQGSGRWLKVRVEGGGGNRFGIGARVRVMAGGIVQTREILCGGSYLGNDSPVAHFGLGRAQQADWVEVRFPAGGSTGSAAALKGTRAPAALPGGTGGGLRRWVQVEANQTLVAKLDGGRSNGR